MTRSKHGQEQARNTTQYKTATMQNEKNFGKVVITASYRMGDSNITSYAEVYNKCSYSAGYPAAD